MGFYSTTPPWTPPVDQILINLLNGIGSGLLLFMLSSGLTLIFSMMGVLKFGHVRELLISFSFSYVVLEVVQLVWGRTPLQFDPPPRLQSPAFTVMQSTSDGLSNVPGASSAAEAAAQCSRFPMTRAFMMLVAPGMLLALWLLLTRTRIGPVIQAALTHPEMAEAPGPQRAARVHAGVRRR